MLYPGRKSSAVSKESAPEQTEVTIVSPTLLDLPSQKHACLVVIIGGEIGKRLTLEARELSIGRSSSADLQLDLDSVSRSHAVVMHTPRGWVLRDLGSTNGTLVNDQPIRERMLEDGDRIRIGRAMLKFLSGTNVEAQYHEEIYRLMTLDGLTQVYNKRYFHDAIEHEFARSKRYKHAFSLVLLDIDHFKQINDSHGHLAGDEVLRRVAASIKSKVRTNDVVARVGGEEFAVLSPETDLAGAVTLAEKLRRALEGERVVHESKTIAVTISAGVACFADELKNSDALVQRADERLYAAKRGGRNRVCS